MSMNVGENASQELAPFVDQLPNGPGVSRIDPSDPPHPSTDCSPRCDPLLLCAIS